MTNSARIVANLAIVFACSFICLNANAEDWPRFRGAKGAGVSTKAAPTAWSDSANLAWKSELPGPGASSPIIIGDKIFITCYSGYGNSVEEPGDIEDLQRHLVCIDMKTGDKVWQKDVKAVMPEDKYTGAGVPAHGYASHTPVSDGKNIYAFFGKSGVFAYDMSGNELWQADVGKESDPTRWGSSSSPVLYKDTVIVTASAESQSIVGIDRNSGKELWRQEAKGLDGMWGTPSLVKVDDDRTDLVMIVAKELWGLDPENGEMRWFADATQSQHAYTSVLHEGKRVFAFTGRGGGSVAVDIGGKGNISETNTAWTGRDAASFATPVRHEGKIYLVAGGILTVVDAESGKRVDRMRLKGMKKTGGRFGTLDYASPIVVGNHLYYMNGSGQMYVFELGDKTKLVSVNEVTKDKEVFWGTPSASDGRIVLRSQKYLYCLADKGETVEKNEDSEADAESIAADEEEATPRRRQRFNPDEFFKQADKNEDGSLSMEELEGNRLAERIKPMDKDDNKLISKEEFTTGIAALQRGGGRRGRGGAEAPKRPDRPQRPAMAGAGK